MTVETAVETDDAEIIVTTEPLPIAPLNNKLITFTRLLTLSSGLQSISGVGFAPRFINFRSCINTAIMSIGAADASLAQGCSVLVGGVWSQQGYAGLAAVDASNFQTFTVVSLDADGFTISWAKTASPTGTVTVYAECFR